jgi:protein-S-isoprenylcysteine O-methyltransferase Ste14
VVAGAWRGRGDANGTLLVVAMLTGITLILVGVAILTLGFRHLGSALSVLPKPVDNTALVVHGIYAYVRHPFYVGVALVLVGFSVAMDSFVGLVMCVPLVVVLDLKSRREEVWLRQRYPGYASYASRTKRFVPYVY